MTTVILMVTHSYQTKRKSSGRQGMKQHETATLYTAPHYKTRLFSKQINHQIKKYSRHDEPTHQKAHDRQ